MGEATDVKSRVLFAGATCEKRTGVAEAVPYPRRSKGCFTPGFDPTDRVCRVALSVATE